MEKPILVIGHRNPDTDSICSAIGYAFLKRKLGFNAEAARAGKINNETKFVLEKFGVEAPKLVDDLYPRLGDSPLSQPPTATPTTTIHDIGKLFLEHRPKGVPVVEDSGQVVGLVTVNDLANRYYDELAIHEMAGAEVDFGSILKILNGKLWCGALDKAFKGTVHIGAATPAKMCKNLQPGDLIITADRVEAQKAALDVGIACLVLTMDTTPSQEVIDLANLHHSLIISTDYNTYNTARLIQQSVQVRYIMAKNFDYFTTSAYLSDVREKMLSSEVNIFPVIEKGKYIGSIDKNSMLKPAKQEVILVDHNESSQAVEGIEHTKVIEIIDHHRLGGLTTSMPVFIRQDPVGSTATLVAKMAWHRDVILQPAIAGLLLSAILSDTLYFKSPTATEEDKRVANKLAEIAGIEDVKGYAMELLRHGSALNSLTAEEIVHNDVKEFDFTLGKVTVTQVIVMDAQQAKEKQAELQAALQATVDKQETDTALLMITNIMEENTDLLWAGRHKDLLDAAFGEQTAEGTYHLPGVLSRKKQIIPPLSEAFR